jgi:hypothetical protein
MAYVKTVGQVTIPNGTSLSGAVNLGAKTLCAITVPISWSATPSLSFQVSEDGGVTWGNLYDSTGTEVTVTAAAGQRISISSGVFASVDLLKVRSGTSGTPVTQLADRVLTIVSRKQYGTA